MRQLYNKIAFLIHPILLAVYPILFLYSYNISQTAFTEILLPAIISLGFSLILLFIIILFSKNKLKSSLFISLLLFLFFSYGHLSEILFHKLRIKNPDYTLLPLYSIVFILLAWLIIKSKVNLKNIADLVNIITISLILFSCFSIIKFSLGSAKLVIPEADLEKRISTTNIKTDNLPDIYYIILDGYAGEETLRDVYNFDNSEFLNFLRSNGFFVASKSRSNYAHTSLSVASTLNMRYINDLISQSDRNEKKMGLMYELINNNIVQKKLKNYGYHTIHINSTSAFARGNSNADVVIEPAKINEFNYILIKTTLLSPLFNTIGFSNIFRRRILNTFEIIPKIAKLDYKTYTFAHIMVPHPPYLFRKNQMPYKHTARDMIGFQWDDRTGYVNQVIAVNSLVKDMVRAILRDSGKMPVIILQGDHGTASLLENPHKGKWENPTKSMLKERFDIFNAFLFPGINIKKIPEDVTSVNTFRYFFYLYFKEDYVPFKNKYYFSTFKDIFKLNDVSDNIN